MAEHTEHDRILDTMERDAAYEKRTGGPAFPTASRELDPSTKLTRLGRDGMSLRDYFAGQALEGVCANALAVAAFVKGAHMNDRTPEQEMAHNVYAIADAMLAERAK